MKYLVIMSFINPPWLSSFIEFSSSQWAHSRRVSPTEPPSPAVRCPACSKVQILQTLRLQTRIFYLCLVCGKRFDHKINPKDAVT